MCFEGTVGRLISACDARCVLKVGSNEGDVASVTGDPSSVLYCHSKPR